MFSVFDDGVSVYEIEELEVRYLEQFNLELVNIDDCDDLIEWVNESNFIDSGSIPF